MLQFFSWCSCVSTPHAFNNPTRIARLMVVVGIVASRKKTESKS